MANDKLSDKAKTIIGRMNVLKEKGVIFMTKGENFPQGHYLGISQKSIGKALPCEIQKFDSWEVIESKILELEQQINTYPLPTLIEMDIVKVVN